MTAKPYPTDLTDAEWDLIKDLIPPPKPGGRHRELDMRAVVNAIFYVVDGASNGVIFPMSIRSGPVGTCILANGATAETGNGCMTPFGAGCARKQAVISPGRRAASTVKASRRRHWVGSGAMRVGKR